MENGGTSQPADAPSSGTTVLLIDDEEVVREVFAETLADGGLNVLTACDGETGVDVFKNHVSQISLVVLDLSMPGIDGAETFKRLKAVNPGVKVVLSSGYAEEEAMDKFEGLGLTGFLQKPYQWSRLMQILQAFLG
jgi:two-component system, cell cycle sensor histidine kinase and response regulator CckA